jgi:formate dehydrogenase iron-sulfur subunit
MDRRTFLKNLGIGITGMTCGSILGQGKLHAQGLVEGKEFLSILIDTTRCIGCRSCELACAQTYDLPIPNIEDNSVFEKERRTTETQWTIVNRYKTDKGTVYAVKRCMHCNQPACVSACLVKAMKKRQVGPVTWDDNCMGCKMCAFSCPFDKAILEAHSPSPRIRKCFFCWDKRLVKGEIPACVEACPTEALVFGTRRDLLEDARTRLYQQPDRYVHQIYGETEVGGTSVMYLSAVPFEQLGFRTDLGTTALPELSTGFLYAVPIIFVLWPAFLLGVHRATQKEEEE